MKRILAALVLAVSPMRPGVAQTVLGDSAACAAGATVPAVLAWIEGFKDRKGKVRLELFPDNDEDFLQDDFILTGAGKTFRRIELPTPPSGPVAICLRAPKSGRYTMALVHDRDGLRKFSFSVDGVGFPGNPKMGWGKPKAEKAMVIVGSGVTILHIRLNYFHGLGFSPLKREG